MRAQGDPDLGPVAGLDARRRPRGPASASARHARAAAVTVVAVTVELVAVRGAEDHQRRARLPPGARPVRTCGDDAVGRRVDTVSIFIASRASSGWPATTVVAPARRRPATRWRRTCGLHAWPPGGTTGSSASGTTAAAASGAVELAGRGPCGPLGRERRGLLVAERRDRLGVLGQERARGRPARTSPSSISTRAAPGGHVRAQVEQFVGADRVPADAVEEPQQPGRARLERAALPRSATTPGWCGRRTGSRRGPPCRRCTGRRRRCRPRSPASRCGPGCTSWSPAGGAGRAGWRPARRGTRRRGPAPGTRRRTPCGRRRRRESRPLMRRMNSMFHGHQGASSRTPAM